MKEGTGMGEAAGIHAQDTPDIDARDTAGVNAQDEADMDVQDAALILRDASQRARRELTINRPLIFASWALVYLLGYGTVWLSVRNQHPYHAPQGWGIAVVVVLAAMAVSVTAGLTDRATSGVGGATALRRRIYGLSLLIGLLGIYIMQPALVHVGANRNVIGVLGASGPLLVAGIVLVASTAAWLNWYMFGLGVWIIGVAAFSGFAGPAGVWAVDALAMGVPFLLIAAATLAFARARS